MSCSSGFTQKMISLPTKHYKQNSFLKIISVIYEEQSLETLIY